ncbi:MAG: acyl-CoA/acyl-ACP dehydrogenase [Halieaceae bacterium]|nr:acyl-CoA/acyl-ACP dehydrogenase [Halieaceae bacterium]
MDYSIDTDHQTIVDLAEKIFSDHADDAYITSGTQQVDARLWQLCAEAGFTGLDMPESVGGSGLGFSALCRVLKALGAITAPIPLLSTAVAAYALGNTKYKSQLQPFVGGQGCIAISLNAGLCFQGDRIVGSVNAVAYADSARLVVLACQDKVLVVEQGQLGVDIQVQTLSSGQPAGLVQIDIALADAVLGDGLTDLQCRLQTATAWQLYGVLDEALRRTARYTTERKQFGKPVATFQAVAHRAANSYIDLECLKGAAEQAAWLIDEQRPAELEAGMAYWWACEAAHRVVHSAQHLHGGMGADLTYPIHRYFLRAKELEFSLGGGSKVIDRIGQQLVEQLPENRRLVC